MVRARRLCCSVHTVGKTKDSSCIFNPPGLRLFLILFLLFLSRPKCQGLSYQRFLVRPLLREPRPRVHYKSQPDATAQRETQKSTNVKSLLSPAQPLVPFHPRDRRTAPKHYRSVPWCTQTDDVPLRPATKAYVL